MKYQTLSVVMPNYNDALFIGDALGSILTQSYQPAEVIVVDDGSTDDSVAVIGAITKRCPTVKLLRNDKNQGVIYSVNRGVREASGEYVHVPSSNDRVFPGLYEKSMALLAKYPSAGLCFSDAVFFETDSSAVREVRRSIWTEPRYVSPDDFVADLRCRRLHIATNTAIAKRAFVAEAGNYLPQLKWHSDGFLAQIVACRHGLCYLPEPLAAVRVDPNSYSHHGAKQTVAEREILRSLLDILESKPYQDVAPAFRQAHNLYRFAPCMGPILFRDPRIWKYLWPSIAWRLLWRLRQSVRHQPTVQDVSGIP